MHDEIVLLSRDDAVPTIKEGSVAVRGHFIVSELGRYERSLCVYSIPDVRLDSSRQWRDRYVVVRKGMVVVHRRKCGSVKTKVRLSHWLQP